MELMGVVGQMFGERQPLIKPVLDTIAEIINKGGTLLLVHLAPLRTFPSVLEG